MKWYWIKTVLCIAFALPALESCVDSDSRNKISPGVYDKETMAHVLAEMHLVEAAYRSGAIEPEVQGKGRQVQQKVLERLGSDTLQFDESFAYYSANSKKLEEVYDLVNIELTKKKLDALENQKKP